MVNPLLVLQNLKSMLLLGLFLKNPHIQGHIIMTQFCNTKKYHDVKNIMD